MEREATAPPASKALRDRDAEFLRLALAILAVEVALARITSGVQGLLPLCVDTLAFVLVGGIAQWIHAGCARRRGMERWVAASMAALLVACVVFALVNGGLRKASGDMRWPLSFGCAGLAALALFFTRLRTGNEAVVPATVCMLWAASALTWIFKAASLPPAPVVAALAGACAVTAAVARTAAWPALPVLAAAFALAPVRLLAPPPIPWTERDPAHGPDIILIVADTLRADAALELEFARRMTERGTNLGPAQSASTWTLPAMASMMTSRPVSEHGARLAGDGQKTAMGTELTTLAEALAAGGYDTAAVIATNINVDARFGFGRGFDYFDFGSDGAHRFALPVTRGGAARPLVHQLLLASLQYLDAVQLKVWVGYGDSDAGSAVVERVQQLVERRRARPLFLWAHFMDVHVPYSHAAEFEHIDIALRGELTDFDVRVRTAAHWKTDAGRTALRQAYRGELAHLDRALARLMQTLGPAPAWGRVVVLTSDHGEELFEHGGYEHGHAFYQEVVGVPLFVEGLPLRAPAAPVSSLDIAPTLLGAAHLPVPEGMRGLDLANELPGRDIESRGLLYAADSAWIEDARAVRHGDWKLIEHGEVRLFDLARDPAERQDLAASRAPIVEQLQRSRSAMDGRGQPVALDAADIEGLRALGYAQ